MTPRPQDATPEAEKLRDEGEDEDRPAGEAEIIEEEGEPLGANFA